MSISIYIPTRGRIAEQITFASLTPQLRTKVTFVVNRDEKGFENLDGPVLRCPPTVKTIGGVRQYICDYHYLSRRKQVGPHLIMLDDDLRFFARRSDDPTKFLPVTDRALEDCFKAVDRMLMHYPNVGILAREGGNRITADYVECTRLLRALAYDVGVLHTHNIRFDRLIVMEDFDVALQLLRAGYKTAALCSYVQDQRGSNAPGGCSIYRTLEKQAQGAKGLAKLHAPFVKLVMKTTKTAWNGATRTDVIVRWKDAYASSQE